MIPEPPSRGSQPIPPNSGGSEMNSKPTWVWKQRYAIGRFMISFYFRRGLNLIREALPRCCKPAVKVKARPRRHRRVENSTQSGVSQRASG
jgi:hypothetical protein